jgi:hypothetical protein
MGDWYEIGLSVGLGAGAGVLLAGILASTRVGAVLAVVLGAGAGLLIGLAIGEWDEAVGGIAGGLLGAAGAAPLVRGTLRGGGTRIGTALLVAGGALVVTGLAAVPALGYVEALAIPLLGIRLASHVPKRFAGLRTLAR